MIEFPTIKINFSDFWQGFDCNNNFILDLLSLDFKIELSDSPDILFCCHFGEQYKTKKGKKILIVMEPEKFEINNFDYAIGWPYLNDKRFFHFNFYNPLDNKLSDRSKYSDISLTSRKFCNFIYSNESTGDGAKLRKNFCMELEKYKHVDCPGKVLNNMKNAIGPRNREDYVITKRKFIQNYKFTIAFENNRIPGYTTEKLWDPFYVGSIPIYWGNPMIEKEANTDSFINCNDFDNDFDAIIKRIKEIDADNEYYMYMIQKSPIVKDYNSNINEIRNIFRRIIY